MELLIGFIFAIVLWLLSPEPHKRRLRRLFGRLLTKHPSKAIEIDIAVFKGRVEILSDELLSHAANDARRIQFYEMAPLDWDIIGAHADIERDQQAEVIEQLRRSIHSLRFVCILGEPGSGKSTLAWRVAAELHKNYRAVVIHVKDREDPEVWYRMNEFCCNLGKHFYVLADDIFRNPEVGRALQELSPWLPVTILATSQTNEYRPGRLKGEVVAIPLSPPSSGEKERILHLLGRNVQGLSAEQLNQLERASEFLILMVVLTSGKGFQDVVQDSLDNLLRRHDPIYRAYEYLCFAYSYGTAIPVSLLDRLDMEGRYINLPNQEGAQGLIFYNDLRSGWVRPGHPQRAETARKLFEKRRSSIAVLHELVMGIDVSSSIERKFIAQLLRTLADRKIEFVQESLPQIGQHVAMCVQQANSLTELIIWRAFYFSLGLFNEANKCVEASLAIDPSSDSDCNLILMLCRDSGRESDALLILDRWLKSHPEVGGSRPAYIGLIARYGSESEQQIVIDNTKSWLAAHSDDSSVRAAYLGLVEQKGTIEQTECAIQDTSVWLIEHANDNAVRTAYLGLVENKGTAEQIERMLQEISVWLASHMDDNYVRTAYLGLVKRKGTVIQTERVLQEISAWLETYADDNYVRTAYLSLVELKGTTEQIEHVLQGICIWLAAHKDDSNVRTAYLGLVERKGTPDQIKSVLQETPKWLRSHQQSTDVWARFISFLCRMEKFDDARSIAEEAMAIHSKNSNLVSHYLNLMQDRLDESKLREIYISFIKSFPRDTVIRESWAHWLHNHNYRDEAEEVFKGLIAEHPKSFPHRYKYGKMLLDMERYSEASDQFRQVLKIRHGHAMAHDGLAFALQGLARYVEKTHEYSDANELFSTSEREFKNAILSAGLRGDPQAIFYSHLGWFYIDRNRWSEAINAFAQAINENPNYFGNYWGQGHAFMALKQWQDAQKALHIAREKARDTIDTPISNEIRQLIEQSEAELKNNHEKSQVVAT